MMSRFKKFMGDMENGSLLEFTGDSPPDIVALKAAVANEAAIPAAQGTIANNFGRASRDGFSNNPKDGGPTQSVSMGGGAAMTSVIKM